METLNTLLIKLYWFEFDTSQLVLQANRRLGSKDRYRLILIQIGLNPSASKSHEGDPRALIKVPYEMEDIHGAKHEDPWLENQGSRKIKKDLKAIISWSTLTQIEARIKG